MRGRKFEWSDYFSDSPGATLGPGLYNSRQSYSSTSVYILNCLFNSFTSSSSGGALYFSSAADLFVESSSFFSCKTSGSSGGAIYSNSGNGQSVLYRVCGYDCYSTYTSSSSYHQFGYISAKDLYSSKNYANYSSVVRCVNGNSDSKYTFCLDFGRIICTSLNSSNNKLGYYSGICCYPFISSSYVTSSYLYSTFADNIATSHTCIWLNRGSPIYEIKHCNIIRNTQSSSSGGTIYPYGNTNIEDSCILENIATNIFCISSSSYTITLSKCTVDKTTNNNCLTIKNTVTKSFIHGLSHIVTRNCHSEFDSVGNLIPTKEVIVLTCKNNYRVRIGDFFTLAWVFMVTFVHSNGRL